LSCPNGDPFTSITNAPRHLHITTRFTLIPIAPEPVWALDVEDSDTHRSCGPHVSVGVTTRQWGSKKWRAGEAWLTFARTGVCVERSYLTFTAPDHEHVAGADICPGM
jgi:hypothetical protein